MDNLVFSGGGVKGICFVGAIKELEKLGHLNVKNLAGTSVGSIVASLIALGFNAKEIKQLMMDKINFNNIVDHSNVLTDAYHIMNNYGYGYGNYIYDILGEIIKSKTNNENYTFEDLYHDKQVNLIISATNLNQKKLICFNYVTHPKMSIRLAIRMSTSVPFLYMPVIYEGEYYVDGGTLNNYMIDIFDNVNKNTLGLKISQPHEIHQINHFYDYAYSFIETFMADNERKELLNVNIDRTVFIETPAYPLSKFDLTMDEKIHLIKQGKKSVRKFFK
jgi:NTE family protein